MLARLRSPKERSGFALRDPGKRRSRPGAGPRPDSPARAPLRRKGDGRRTTRERGRPARILSRCVPLRFPAMGQPTVLPAGTTWARPKRSRGAVAGPSGSRRWARLRQDWCGRDARAPGRASSRDVVAPAQVHRSSFLWVFILTGVCPDPPLGAFIHQVGNRLIGDVGVQRQPDLAGLAGGVAPGAV